HQATVFEEFAQGDNQASRKHGGTGLGLSISKKLVEHMNGSIELFSQEGVGSAFSVHLPLMITQSSGEVLTGTSRLPEPLRSASILLIDDDEFNRLLFRTLFDAHDKITFSEAENAVKGFALLNEQRFDLIITDIQMPGLSGVDMIRELRKNPDAMNRFTPVLACTADVTPETLKDIRESGIEDHLIKPVDEDELMDKINHLLSRSTPQELPAREPHAEQPSGALSCSNNLKKLYDLEGLMAFTGNDPKSIVPVIEVFIKDTKVNLSLLDENLKQNNRQEIYRVIHKMDNMFGLLKAENALFHLKKLNPVKDTLMSEKEMHENVRNIINISSHVIQSLDADLKAISLGSYPEN
ncbi:MAG: response regulator, partial [Bacteroidales bacterium]